LSLRLLSVTRLFLLQHPNLVSRSSRYVDWLRISLPSAEPLLGQDSTLEHVSIGVEESILLESCTMGSSALWRRKN